MAKTVFILGAGASKQAGVPLMAGFLREAEDLLRLGKFRDPEIQRRVEIVLQARNTLQTVHSKSQFDIWNVEAVFAAFEMAHILQRFGNYTAEEIANLTRAMNTTIVNTVEETLRFPKSGNDIGIPEPYNTFVDLIQRLRQEVEPPHTVAVITFNYDLALDYALDYARVKYDYALEEKELSNEFTVPLLKLHGSLNWGRCQNPECKEVVAWPIMQAANHRWVSALDQYSPAFLKIGSKITQLQHCDQPVESEPVIVPPTWNKSEHQLALSRVWARAAYELSEAENIFVSGYSLPDTDFFFKYLYALGSVGEVILRRFWVFDPDIGIEAKYQKLLGPGAGAGAEHVFRFEPMTFEIAIAWLQEHFQVRSDHGVYF